MTRSLLIFAITAAAIALVCATLIYTLLTSQGTGGVASPQHVSGATLKDRPAPTDSVAAVEPTSAPVSLALGTGTLIPAQSYQGDNAFRSQGVLEYRGWRVTYYDPSRLGISAEALGLKTVGVPIVDRGDGIGVCSGLIAVSLPAEYPYGTQIDTPFGMGVCVDHSVSAMDVVVFW